MSLKRGRGSPPPSPDAPAVDDAARKRAREDESVPHQLVKQESLGIAIPPDGGDADASALPSSPDSLRAIVIERKEALLRQKIQYRDELQAELFMHDEGESLLDCRASTTAEGKKRNVDDSAASSVESRGTAASHLSNGIQSEVPVKSEPKPAPPTPAPPPVIDQQTIKDRETVVQAKQILKKRKVLPKFPEPARNKCHWDYLLEEMAWLSNDFKEERKWKMALAKKVSKAVDKYWQLEHSKVNRHVKEEEARIRKVAAGIARDVRKFWGQIEKIKLHKQNAKLDEKKKAVMDRHLDFLVGQTERYTSMLAKDIQASTAAAENAAKAAAVQQTPGAKQEAADEAMEEARDGSIPADPNDAEFIPVVDENDEDDDEATLEEEEENAEDPEEEVEALQTESDMPIQQLLSQYGDLSEMPSSDEDEDDEDEDEDDEKEEDDDETAAGKSETKDKGVEDEDLGTEALLDFDDGDRGEKRVEEESATASQLQPSGSTLDAVKEGTGMIPTPSLMRHGDLREYQLVGLNWLARMHDKRLNGILADEMGLGKTIMTIALLAHLACDKGVWGPHLIVVPTSVMLNWEIELKRWCPAFKVMTYYGSIKERKAKRVGWSKTNAFHVCITSYRLVVQDQAAFRRKKWKYFILDEAQNIKNFRSQRWQVLLNFNAKRRLLLTGTPLQNNIMELWSLMHFLMPHVFSSHKEFSDWFSKPLNNMVDGTEEMNMELVKRLHNVLRPFLLRRVKRDVAKQLPGKTEHVVMCNLSKRQRNLYDEFMASASTKDKMASGNLLEIMNVLMQLRKVCNHPDLFETRPIDSPFHMPIMPYKSSSSVFKMLEGRDVWEKSDLKFLNFVFTENDARLASHHPASINELKKKQLIVELPSTADVSPTNLSSSTAAAHVASASANLSPSTSLLTPFLSKTAGSCAQWAQGRRESQEYVNTFNCNCNVMYGYDLIRKVSCRDKISLYAGFADQQRSFEFSHALRDMVYTHDGRCAQMRPVIDRYVVAQPATIAAGFERVISHPEPSTVIREWNEFEMVRSLASTATAAYQPSLVRQQLGFPDKSLVQYDCGKLQTLAKLLRELKDGGHRCLIFTQMTRMLDVLEVFLNYHGHIYLRLDGSTKIEERQLYMEKFNNMPKYFVFILSTRSGGVGINLVGADTVIFYDSDWNPAMDKQAQDRCHRIGQTREVSIYRLISERTVEENILKKSNQKRHLESVVVKDGFFSPDNFKKMDVRDLFSTDEDAKEDAKPSKSKAQKEDAKDRISSAEWLEATKGAEEETDVQALERAKQEEAVDEAEFDENAPLPDDDNPDAQLLPQIEKEEDTQISFLNELTPIQRYALRLVEFWDPPVMASAGDVEMLPENEWELEMLQRMKEEEEERMDEDDEVLYYEVSGSSSKVYEYQTQLLEKNGFKYELEMYGPPDPDDDGTCGGHADDIFAAKEARSRRRMEKENAAFNESARKLFGNNATLLGVARPKSTDPDALDDADAEVVAQDDSESDLSGAEDTELGGLRHRQHFPSRKVKLLFNVQGAESVRGEADDTMVAHILPAARINWRNDQVGPPKRATSDRSGLFPRPGQKPRNIPRRPGQARKLSAGGRDGEPILTDVEWSTVEESYLAWAVSEFGPNWQIVSDVLNSSDLPTFRYFRRSPRQCQDTWTSSVSQRDGGRPSPMPEGQPAPFSYIAGLVSNDGLLALSSWSTEISPSGGMPLLSSTPQPAIVPPPVKVKTPYTKVQKGARDGNLDDPLYRFSMILKYQKVTNNKSIQSKSHTDANRQVTQHDSHNKAIVGAGGTCGKGCKPHEVVCKTPKEQAVGPVNMRGGAGALTKMDSRATQQHVLVRPPGQTGARPGMNKKMGDPKQHGGSGNSMIIMKGNRTTPSGQMMQGGAQQGSSQFNMQGQQGMTANSVVLAAGGQTARFAQINQSIQGGEQAGFRYDGQGGQPVSPAQKRKTPNPKTTGASPRKTMKANGAQGQIQNQQMRMAPQQQTQQVQQQQVQQQQVQQQPHVQQHVPQQQLQHVHHTQTQQLQHVHPQTQVPHQSQGMAHVSQSMAHASQNRPVQLLQVSAQQMQQMHVPQQMQQLPMQQVQYATVQQGAQPLQQSFAVQMPNVHMQIPQALHQGQPMMVNQQGQPIMMQQQQVRQVPTQQVLQKPTQSPRPMGQ